MPLPKSRDECRSNGAEKNSVPATHRDTDTLHPKSKTRIRSHWSPWMRSESSTRSKRSPTANEIPQRSKRSEKRHPPWCVTCSKKFRTGLALTYEECPPFRVPYMRMVLGQSALPKEKIFRYLKELKSQGSAGKAPVSKRHGKPKRPLSAHLRVKDMLLASLSRSPTIEKCKPLLVRLNTTEIFRRISPPSIR